MKRILYLSVLLMLLLHTKQTTAQCTPGNYSTPGIYPDSSSALPPAAATQQYDFTFTIVVPLDTTISIGGVPQQVSVDSIGITDITGLPSSMQYVTNSSSDYWPGGSSGCFVITGTPTNADVGTHSFEIHMQASGGGFSAPITYTGHELVVLDSTHVSVVSKEEPIDEVSAFPNPFSSSVTIRFVAYKPDDVTISMVNLVGKVMEQKQQLATAGVNMVEFNLDDIPEGIYFYRIQYGDKVVTRKLIKK